MDKIPELFSKKIDSFLIIDISSGLKVLKVELKGGIKVSALKIIELADKKDETIIAALGNFLKENRISEKNFILIPPLASCIIKRIQLPAVPGKELTEAIKWQMKKEITFDAAGAILDYQIIKKVTKEDGAVLLDIICALAQEEEIRGRILKLKQLGFKCIGVSPLPFGYTKIIERYFKEIQNEPVGILHLEGDNCYLAICKENKLVFYRDLPLSFNQLRDSLAVELATVAGKIKLSAAEINEILFTHGIPIEGSGYKDKLAANQIFALLRPSLERLLQEIKRSLLYYDSQFQGGTVKRILIGGSAARIPNIDTFLKQELPLNFSKLSLADKVKVASGVNASGIDPDDLSANFADIGLAIDYQDNINLLPLEFRMEKAKNAQKLLLRWVSFIIFLFLFVSFVFSKAIIGSYQKRLDNALIHLNVLSEIKQTKAKIDAFDKIIEEARKNEIPLGAILKKLSNIAAPELFFNDFSINCESKAGIINGFVKSVTVNPDIILTKFLDDMLGSGYFKDAAISSVERTAQVEVFITTFKINFKLR